MGSKEFARQKGLSLRTLRYYMRLGLVRPIKTGGQLIYDDRCEQEWRIFCRLKDCGFTLREIRAWMDLETASGYTHEEKRTWKIQRLRRKAEETHCCGNDLCAMQEQLAAQVAYYSRPWQLREVGSAIELLEYVCCPNCQQSMVYQNVHMANQTIISGVASCPCGYAMEIQNGIFLVRSDSEGEPSIVTLDHHRETYLRMSSASVSRLQVGHHWMMKKLQSESLAGRVIFENAVDVISFLGTGIGALSPEARYIIADSNAEVLQGIKRRIEALAIRAKVLYLVCPTLRFPLRHGCVDYLLDYYTSEVLQRLNISTLAWEMRPYLAENARLVGVFSFIAKGYRTVQENLTRYPNSFKERYQRAPFRANLIAAGIVLEDEFTPIPAAGNSVLESYQSADLVGDYCFFGKYCAQ